MSQTRSISPRYVGEANSTLENEIEIDPFMGIEISRNTGDTPNALTKYTGYHIKRREQCIMLETLWQLDLGKAELMANLWSHWTAFHFMAAPLTETISDHLHLSLI
jgi:hypothetical protein